MVSKIDKYTDTHCVRLPLTSWLSSWSSTSSIISASKSSSSASKLYEKSASSGGVGFVAKGYSLVSRVSRGAGSRTKTWGNFLVKRVVVVTVLVSTHSLTWSWNRRLPLGGVLSAMLTETVCVWPLLGRRGSRPCCEDGEGVMASWLETPWRVVSRKTSKTAAGCCSARCRLGLFRSCASLPYRRVCGKSGYRGLWRKMFNQGDVCRKSLCRPRRVFAVSAREPSVALLHFGPRVKRPKRQDKTRRRECKSLR